MAPSLASSSRRPSFGGSSSISSSMKLSMVLSQTRSQLTNYNASCYANSKGIYHRTASCYSSQPSGFGTYASSSMVINMHTSQYSAFNSTGIWARSLTYTASGIIGYVPTSVGNYYPIMGGSFVSAENLIPRPDSHVGGSWSSRANFGRQYKPLIMY